MAKCKIQDCDKKNFSFGWCRNHYERWKRHGDPLICKLVLSPAGATMAWITANKDYDGDDCLIWPFARHPSGRAHMARAKPSRIMCEMAHGKAPSPTHQAAHSCGNANGGCVNPKHLRWATRKENEADKLIHGTRIRGEAHYAAILTEESVREIRSLAGVKQQKEIAAEFGIATTTVCNIIHGHSWRHVDAQ